MIVSHEHRFVFVELPRTGSTAVGKELTETYDGERILKKHSTYRDFLRSASGDEKGYFAFSSIRHPMDDAVSGYFKIHSDHHGRYSDPVRRRYRVGERGADRVRSTGMNAKGVKPRRRSAGERRDNRRYEYLRRTDSDFASYFLRFYRAPYDTWSSVTHSRMDFVIRFEDLEHDFERALGHLGLDLRRPLPVRNRTVAKEDDFQVHYTPETRKRATWVFGPYMQRFGYDFPENWRVERLPVSSRMTYHALSVPRRIYWDLLR